MEYKKDSNDLVKVDDKNVFNGIEEVEDKMKIAISKNHKKTFYNYKKWFLLLTFTIIIIVVARLIVLQNWLSFGGKGTIPGHGDSSIFMSYAGPVFPLTLSTVNSEIIASRNIVYDFSLPNVDNVGIRGTNVKDNYTLNNSLNEDKTIKAIYPFAASFKDFEKEIPIITVNGMNVPYAFYAGSYSGGFTGVYGNDTLEGSMNILQLNSWKGYKTLLEDGSYKSSAFTPYPVLSQKVTVYTFTDFIAPSEYDAATQGISFTIDPNKTTIMQYGFNGSEYKEDGFRRYSYFVPNQVRSMNDTKMLIVIGDDIRNYTLQGYKNGACEKGNELDGVSVNITRKERVLSDVIDELVTDFFAQYDNGGSLIVPKNMFLGAVSELMYQYGILSQSVRERYQDGRLEDIFLETNTLNRVLYLEFEVAIPAGESVLITCDMDKKASYDFYCTDSKDQGVYGYDMVTQLGSNLHFDVLEAEIIPIDQIEIVRQNFGFNLPLGITKVTLDPMEEHYYMDLRTTSSKIQE